MKNLFVATLALSLLTPALHGMGRLQKTRNRTQATKSLVSKQNTSILTEAVKALASDCQENAHEALAGKVAIRNRDLVIAFLKVLQDDPTLEEKQKQKIQTCIVTLTHAAQEKPKAPGFIVVKSVEEHKMQAAVTQQEPITVDAAPKAPERYFFNPLGWVGW